MGAALCICDNGGPSDESGGWGLAEFGEPHQCARAPQHGSGSPRGADEVGSQSRVSTNVHEPGHGSFAAVSTSAPHTGYGQQLCV